MIETPAELNNVVSGHVISQLFAMPEATVLFGRYDRLNDEEFDGISGYFSLDNLELQQDDLITLHGSIEDHVAQGFGIVAISGAINEVGYFYDPFSGIENEVYQNVEFYAALLVDYSTGTVVDSDITYDVARNETFDESTVEEIRDGVVLYELNPETTAVFGFDAPSAGDTSLVERVGDALFEEPQPPIVPDSLTLEGSYGDDTLTGADGDDKLLGGNGDDKLRGNDGDDLIKGGSGNDELRGGNGNDLLNGNRGDDVLYGLSGEDRLLGGGGDDFLHGGHDADRLYGHQGNDALYGGRDGDYLNGAEGDDSLFGENGNDTLFGGQGDDVVSGGRNNDILNGGAGNDVLSGGQGSDVFVVGIQDGVDTISDFTIGEDLIALSGFDGDLSDLFLSQEDSAVRIQWGETEILLENINQDDLSQSDFVI